MKSQSNPITFSKILRAYLGPLFNVFATLGFAVAMGLILLSLLTLSGCSTQVRNADSPLRSYTCISHLSCA